MLGRAHLPPAQGRLESHALGDTVGTPLGRALAPPRAAHPDQSGIHPLPVPAMPLPRACCCAAAAERSIDIQYYIWHGDQPACCCSRRCGSAAERGVRVRLLLDDVNTGGLDPTLAVARRPPEHRGAAVQPVRAARGSRALGFLDATSSA